MRRIFLSAFAALLLSTPGAWAAGQGAGQSAGKTGLWTIITTWQFGMKLVPPALVSLSRQQGLKPPVTGQPFIHHICMTADEADGSQPLHLNSRDLDCVNRTVSQRGTRMIVESVCHGPLEGVGRAQITWRGNQHFEGSYAFKGRFRGDSSQMSSSFSADWTGADCRGVRPFILPLNN